MEIFEIDVWQIWLGLYAYLLYLDDTNKALDLFHILASSGKQMNVRYT